MRILEVENRQAESFVGQDAILRHMTKRAAPIYDQIRLC
jgi:hypothetical protein